MTKEKTIMSLYFKDEDYGLLNKITKEAAANKRSLSAQVLYIIQEYYNKGE